MDDQLSFNAPQLSLNADQNTFVPTHSSSSSSSSTPVRTMSSSAAPPDRDGEAMEDDQSPTVREEFAELRQSIRQHVDNANVILAPALRFLVKRIDDLISALFSTMPNDRVALNQVNILRFDSLSARLAAAFVRATTFGKYIEKNPLVRSDPQAVAAMDVAKAIIAKSATVYEGLITPVYEWFARRSYAGIKQPESKRAKTKKTSVVKAVRRRQAGPSLFSQWGARIHDTSDDGDTTRGGGVMTSRQLEGAAQRMIAERTAAASPAFTTTVSNASTTSRKRTRGG